MSEEAPAPAVKAAETAIEDAEERRQSLMSWSGIDGETYGHSCSADQVGADGGRYLVDDEWGVMPSTGRGAEDALCTLRDALPGQGWTVREFGPAPSPAGQLTLHADSPDGWVFEAEAVERQVVPGDPSRERRGLECSLVSPVHRRPDGP